MDVPGWTSAKLETRESSALSTATPSAARPSINSRLAAAMPSMESKNSTWAEPADFSSMVHTHFNDGGAAGVGETKQGERNADVVVEIAVGLADRQFGLQQMRDG